MSALTSLLNSSAVVQITFQLTKSSQIYKYIINYKNNKALKVFKYRKVSTIEVPHPTIKVFYSNSVPDTTQKGIRQSERL